MVAGRVVEIADDVASTTQLPPDAVVVARTTSAAVLAGLAGAVANFAEHGGSLAPPRTVTREVGIPAVFGAPGAATLVRGGDRVVVNGATGEVYRVETGDPIPGVCFAAAGYAPGTRLARDIMEMVVVSPALVQWPSRRWERLGRDLRGADLTRRHGSAPVGALADRTIHPPISHAVRPDRRCPSMPPEGRQPDGEPNLAESEKGYQ
jgi:phosphohistidine swiveling domain-containing protein